MSTFLSSRGCIYEVPAAARGDGFYKLTPSIPSSADSPVFIQGVELQDNDVVSPVVTLENFKVLYRFGEAFGNATVYGDILLGPAAGKATGVTRLIDYFAANRISKKGTPVSISMPGGKAYRIYLNGLVIGRVDPELHIQSFLISAIIAEPPN